MLEKTPPSSILLIKLRHHGDVLLTTPVARTLKSRFPECQIDFLLYEGTEALLNNNPDVRRIWSWNKTSRGLGKLWNQLRLARRLRHEKYDVVIHLSDQMQGALLAKLLARTVSIGIDYPKRRNFFWRWCFTTLAPLFPSDTGHTVEQNLLTLSCLGITPTEDEKRCRLVVTPQEESVINVRLQQAGITIPYIVIHPAARWFFKCWEDERFAAVIHHFAMQGWPLILTGSREPHEREMIASILKKMKSPHVVSLAGELTLGQLAALIKNARLFVGVDSVPMHMAAALQKEVVALFGPSKINEWHPWMTHYTLVKARDYGPLLAPDAVSTATEQRYLSNIPVEAVIQAIEEKLATKEHRIGS